MELFNNVTIDYSKYIKRVHFKKGQIVFNEGEECKFLGIIESGQIEVSTLTPLLYEYSINTLNGGDIFGDIVLFSDSPLYQGDAKAIKETFVLYISKQNFLHMLNLDKVLLENYLKILSKKRLITQGRIKVLSQKSIKDKVLFLLNKKLNNGIYYFNSKEDLAKYLNVPRPSLSRTLIELKNEGLIEYGRHFIKIRG